MFKSMARRAMALLALAFLSLAPMVARADYAIVSESSGTVTFTPGVLCTPIITGVVAGVGSAAALVVLWVGVRWLYRVFKGSK